MAAVVVTPSEVKAPLERKASGDGSSAAAGAGAAGARAIVDVYTPEEQKALLEMKRALPPASPRARSAAAAAAAAAHEDHTLMRFLRARSLDVAAAAEMYLAAAAWRKQGNIDAVATGPVPSNFRLLQQCVPQEWHGHCRQGRPVMIQKIGQMHLDLFTRFDTEVVDECHTFMMELGLALAKASSARTGTRIQQKVIIIDLKGIGLGHRKTFRFMKGTAHIDKNYYPETLGQLFMINAPRIAPVLYSMIKPMLDARTQSKVQILGADYAKTLHEYIAPEQLPLEYAGRCACRGAGQACIPEYPLAQVKKAMSGYVSGKKLTAQIVEANVAARARLDVPQPAVAGQEFAYSFSVAKNDVLFSVEFLPATAAGAASSSSSSSSSSSKPEVKAVVLVESSKIAAAADAPHSGVILAPGAGTMRFVFDNSHSRFSAKTVFYAITPLAVDAAPAVEPPLPPGVTDDDEKEVAAPGVRP